MFGTENNSLLALWFVRLSAAGGDYCWLQQAEKALLCFANRYRDLGIFGSLYALAAHDVSEARAIAPLQLQQ